MLSPHEVTKDFEKALCEYTGAKYAVAVNSCTAALLLSVAWHVRQVKRLYWHTGQKFERIRLNVPCRTYVSVPMSIMHGGAWPKFIDKEWSGGYRLEPSDVWDCARRFTHGMYMMGQMQCVSFHASKILGIEQGGAILHDDDVADAWLRKARFDGRTEGVSPIDDEFDMIGYHCYMNPSTAAQGLLKLHSLPKHNPDLPNDNYPDLSKMEIFK